MSGCGLPNKFNCFMLIKQNPNQAGWCEHRRLERGIRFFVSGLAHHFQSLFFNPCIQTIAPFRRTHCHLLSLCSHPPCLVLCNRCETMQRISNYAQALSFLHVPLPHRHHPILCKRHGYLFLALLLLQRISFLSYRPLCVRSGGTQA